MVASFSLTRYSPQAKVSPVTKPLLDRLLSAICGLERHLCRDVS
jgi:hypothetical protein